MKSLDQWLSAYAESHQNPFNQKVHSICVPIITFCVIGLLWCIPTPDAFAQVKYLNWATLFTAFCLVFYALLSMQVFLLMLLQTGVFVGIAATLEPTGYLLEISAGLFVVSWVGQFWGHKVEGKKPSFFEDLQFLLIGPIWVMKKLSGLPQTQSTQS